MRANSLGLTVALLLHLIGGQESLTTAAEVKTVLLSISENQEDGMIKHVTSNILLFVKLL